MSPEIKDLFAFIDKYKPQDLKLETKLKPFVPEYIPAVRDPDPIIKPPRPDANQDKSGLLFLDEPFAALDAITREELQDDLLKLCHMHRTTVLFITHDIAEAIYLSDQVAVMAQGRMIYELEVNLPKPRQVEMRVHPEFSELCWKVRQAMNGGQA